MWTPRLKPGWAARVMVAGAVAATVVAAAACSSGSTQSTGPGQSTVPAAPRATQPGAAQAGATPQTGPAAPPQPVFDPHNFVTAVDNAYYPLKPGTTWVYQGVRDGVTQRDVVTVTSQRKLVDGVSAIVETDVATHNGTLLEKTEDWYAQDKQGNVWYLGEATASYKNGRVDSTEGSWQAGVNGAVPGIIMPKHPKITDSFRQEYYAGHAEDTAWVVDGGLQVKVPYGTVADAIRTLEFTRLEPDVVDSKFYAPGIGIVREVALAGGQEVADLVSFVQR